MVRPASDTDGCLPLPELALRARNSEEFQGIGRASRRFGLGGPIAPYG